MAPPLLTGVCTIAGHWRSDAYLRYMSETKVIYNAECPVCSREIGSYKRYADERALPLRFEALQATDLAALGLTADDAARQLHVLKDGELLRGVPAFSALWCEMPRFAWLGRLIMRPWVRPLVEIIYRWVLAPALYGLHRMRNR